MEPKINREITIVDDFNAYTECMSRLYKAATPSGNYLDLFKNARTDPFGNRILPYRDYSISQVEFELVVEGVIEEFEIPKNCVETFRKALYNGQTPVLKD